jgi:hypothetical protein
MRTLVGRGWSVSPVVARIKRKKMMSKASVMMRLREERQEMKKWVSPVVGGQFGARRMNLCVDVGHSGVPLGPDCGEGLRMWPN